MISQHTIPPYSFNDFEKIEPIERKELQREEISAQVREFLAKGGKVDIVGIEARNPIKTICH